MSLEIFIAAVGYDLLMGLNFGNVYSVSLRQQLQDFGGEDDLVQLLENEKSNTSSCLQCSHFKVEVILEFSKPWLHISPSYLCSTLLFLMNILPQ
jgi:hypothetical protein